VPGAFNVIPVTVILVNVLLIVKFMPLPHKIGAGSTGVPEIEEIVLPANVLNKGKLELSIEMA